MKIIAPWGSVELVPTVQVSGIYQQHAIPQWGWWALPGGRQLGTLELRALCRQQGWLLLEGEFLRSRQAVTDAWMAGQGISSLENTYCIERVAR